MSKAAPKTEPAQKVGYKPEVHGPRQQSAKKNLPTTQLRQEWIILLRSRNRLVMVCDTVL